MSYPKLLPAVALSCAAAFVLSACGGSAGGSQGQGAAGASAAPQSSDDPNASPTGAPDGSQDTRPTTKVMDGPLGNVTVILDKNDNGRHDEGEPSARTDASGIARWDLGAEELSSAPLLALVGVDAVDADHGTVTQPYKLSAPAGRWGLINPLTSIVQVLAKETGIAVEQADAAARSRTGISSMLTDYGADASPSGREAAIAARLWVLATQQADQILSPHVGTADLTGLPISSADVEQAIARTLVTRLPELASAAREEMVQAACSSVASRACASTLGTKVTELIQASELSVAALPMLAAAWRTRTSPSSATPPQDGASLASFAYGDVNNWYYRAYLATAAEVTPDAQGMTQYRQVQRANVQGALVEWGHGANYSRREDLIWDGLAWATCPTSRKMSQTLRDERGIVSSSIYCGGMQRSALGYRTLDLAGVGMEAVANGIRIGLPGYADWGRPPNGYTGSGSLDLTGGSFPAGASLTSQLGVSLGGEPNYDPNSPVLVYSAAVAAGGDTLTDPTTACHNVGPQDGTLGTLEGLIGQFKGTPCNYAQEFITSTASPTPLASPEKNEWWVNSTLSIGVIGTVPVVADPTSYFTGNTVVRLAFSADGQSVKYYRCHQRQVNGSSRNCTQVGNGSYSIEQLGDARVMRLSGVPAIAAPIDYERVFVERGGKVYYGSHLKMGVSAAFRLNLAATNALFGLVGIPMLQP